MNRLLLKRQALIALGAALWGPVVACAADYPVSGVQPHRRPAGAPVVTTADKDAQWYRQALFGVEPPYPASLSFLEDQGAWHTPFTRPGMTGPYDIRGWHRPKSGESR